MAIIRAGLEGEVYWHLEGLKIEYLKHLVLFPSVMEPESTVQIGWVELKKDAPDSSITSGALGSCDPHRVTDVTKINHAHCQILLIYTNKPLIIVDKML